MVNYKNIEHLGVVEYTVVDMGANMEVEFAYMAALVEFDMVVDFGEQDEDVTLNATGCIVKCIHIYPDFDRDSDPMVRFCESRCLKFNDSAL